MDNNEEYTLTIDDTHEFKLKVLIQNTADVEDANKDSCDKACQMLFTYEDTSKTYIRLVELTTKSTNIVIRKITPAKIGAYVHSLPHYTMDTTAQTPSGAHAIAHEYDTTDNQPISSAFVQVLFNMFEYIAITIRSANDSISDLEDTKERLLQLISIQCDKIDGLEANNLSSLL